MKGTFVRLDQREFLIGFALTSTGSLEEKLKYVFRTYDHDKDGVINKKEIDRMVKVSDETRQRTILIHSSRLPCDFTPRMILRIRRASLMS